MSPMPWVRFFPSDWLAGTRGMSAAETGVFISLIAMMYERNEPIAEDHARLARLCGASNSQFKKALESLVLEGKIVRIEGGLWNERVGKETVYRSEKSEVGKQAAEKRWQKSKQNQQSKDANAMPGQCQGNANQKPEPDTEKGEPIGSPKKSGSSRGTRVDGYQPDIAAAVEIGLTADKARLEAEKFLDFWRGKPGQSGVKVDWPATWRNWARGALQRDGPGLRVAPGRAPPTRQSSVNQHIQDQLQGLGNEHEPRQRPRHSEDFFGSTIEAEFVRSAARGH